MGLCLATFQQVFASATDGTIDPNNIGNQYAWSENAGFINFGTGVGAGDIHITDAGITGHAWSDLFGWINMNPPGSGVTFMTPGVLTGSVWGENTGYINFSGVQIDNNGIFSGVATGAVTGDVSFDCTQCTVETDYRPNASLVSSSSGGRSVNRARSSGEGSSGADLGPDTDTNTDTNTSLEESENEEQETDSETPEESAENSEGTSNGRDLRQEEEESTYGAAEGKEEGMGQELGQELPFKLCADTLQDISNLQEGQAIYVTVARGFFLCPRDGFFSPKTNVTRADMIKLVSIGLGMDNEHAQEGVWYQHWRQYLLEKKVIRGDIRPSRYEPKADILALILKAKQGSLQSLPACEKDLSPETPKDAWFCPVIQEAKRLKWIDTTDFTPHERATRAWTAERIYRAFVLSEE